MRFVVKLFGILPVLVVDGTWVYDEQDDDDVEGHPIEGGSAHNFERDYDPLSPTSHHEWEWEDKRKGFGFR